MRKAAEPAETRRGFLEIDIGEGVSVGAVGLDAESIEKGAADQMRRFNGHRADPENYAPLAQIHRLQLRMLVWQIQEVRIVQIPAMLHAQVIGWVPAPRL